LRSDVFKRLQIRVAAASAEPMEKAEITVEQLRLSFPVGYGLDAKAISSLVGAYYDDTQARPYLHATGFLLDPAGKVFNAVYSSRSIGRFTAQDAATLVEFIRRQECGHCGS
jgi:hypothetical protein